MVIPLHAPLMNIDFCLRDRVVCLRQSPEVLFYRSVFPDEHVSLTQTAIREAETLTWLKDYFQLNIDLVKLYDEWSERDAVFYNLRCRFSGNTNAATRSLGEPRVVSKEVYLPPRR
jgi:N-glycosylase/DNA lyase